MQHADLYLMDEAATQEVLIALEVIFDLGAADDANYLV